MTRTQHKQSVDFLNRWPHGPDGPHGQDGAPGAHRAIWTCLAVAWIAIGWIPSAWAAPPPPLAHEAELFWQQVGWMADQADPCPVGVVGWDPPIQIDLMGERFCLYRFVGGPVTPQDILLLSGQPQLDGLESDHLAVAPMASLDDVLKAEQSVTFLQQFGDVSLPPSSYSQSVRLGILDTQPTNEWMDLLGDETSEHGKSLRRWSHHVLCPPTGCLVRSHSRLTLAYHAYHATDYDLALRDEVHGGLVGTIAELGQAIFDEVAGVGMGGPALGPHVINLSVAWDGNIFGGLDTYNGGLIDPDAMPLDVRLVFRSLQHAAQTGVLVIAAAGNQTDHLQPSGPLLPAAWERVSADGYGSSSGAYRPLLYAVGGVDAAGNELSNAQPQSRPPLVAYGDHGTLLTTSPVKVETATLTGSSVSTLVVSTAAAAAWSYAQEIDAGQIMDEIYTSGDFIPGAAVEFCLPNPTSPPCVTQRPSARRISVCRAVERVCAMLGTCDEPFALGSPSPCSPWTGAPINYSDALLSTFVPNSTTSVAGWEPNLPAPDDCALEPQRDPSYGPPSEAACPSWQFTGQAAMPWVDPQPGSTPCPNCPLVRGQLTVDLADNVVGIAKNPTLLLCDQVLNLPMPDLDADLVSSHRVEGISVPADCDDGLLSFVIEDDEGNETSTLSPVQIVH